jgi:flavin reductase (DIM6/NTAB) family NADH-FMN oxidoreductase RutF
MSVADKQSFRDAMAQVGAAVNIITTDGPAGRAGFTASAVCSVTDTPPRCWSVSTVPPRCGRLSASTRRCASTLWRLARSRSPTFWR